MTPSFITPIDSIATSTTLYPLALRQAELIGSPQHHACCEHPVSTTTRKGIVLNIVCAESTFTAQPARALHRWHADLQPLTRSMQSSATVAINLQKANPLEHDFAVHEAVHQSSLRGTSQDETVGSLTSTANLVDTVTPARDSEGPGPLASAFAFAFAYAPRRLIDKLMIVQVPPGLQPEVQA